MSRIKEMWLDDDGRRYDSREPDDDECLNCPRPARDYDEFCSDECEAKYYEPARRAEP